jgi:hypothetical protein
LTVLLGLLAQAGCTPRPRAPALDNSPVYQNDREGFRFLPPEGWTQLARADVPPGKFLKDQRLVSYQGAGGQRVALLEVTLADLPENEDLAAYLSKPSYGASDWRLKSEPESLTIGSAQASRCSFLGRIGKEDEAKEVVSFRRGGRVYFFIGMFAPADTEARDKIRRAVGSIIWK